ncbi:MAG: tRNA (N6-isopentenyl adenosine(37)-C2)-methylthiotransferase MiaB [Acidobacteriota bacterium]
MNRRSRRFYIKTWGCQMNEQDEQKMSSLLQEHGYAPASSASDADLILLNTCSVREKASEKLFTFLGRLKGIKKRSPETLIGVTGCVAQQEGHAIFQRAPHADLVLGPRRIGRLPTLVEKARQRSHASDTALEDLTAISWAGGKALPPAGKAYVTIMEGCNMGCTFCIVPRTRGREIHRPFKQIVDEAAHLADTGVLEVELLGQTVNAYRDGRKLFHHLLAAVARLPGLARLRFTSSHPAFLTSNTAAVMADHPTICPHLHLAVQSGSDRVLRAMRRGYRIGDYLRRLDDLRRRKPGIALSTDIIVGYPAETEADFQATLRLIKEVRYSQVFAFKYSPRPGTAAAREKDDIPDTVKRRRLSELFELQDRISLEENQALVGKIMPVLIHGSSRRDGAMAAGRTACHRTVNIHGLDPSRASGRIFDIEILAGHRHSLSGRPAGQLQKESKAGERRAIKGLS